MGVTYYFGRRVTTTDTGVNTLGGNTQRFYVPNSLTQTVIAYRMGVLAGKGIGSSAPTNRLAIADTTSGGTPDDLLRYTEQFSITNDASNGSDCSVYEADLTAPLLMTPSPGRYSLGMTSRTNITLNAMRPAGSLTGATNRNFYYKGIGATTIPTDPVGGASSYEGHMDLWAITVTNTAPSVPGSLSPSGSVSSGDLTPTLSSTFDDAEETLPNGVAWDYVNQVQVNVRRKSDGVVMWSYTYTETPGVTATTSVDYAGSALTAGIDYEWQTRHSDRAGAWSGWTGWVTFNVNPGGTVSAPSAPSGKILTTSPATFAAGWTHAIPLSTNAVEVRIKQGGSIVQTSPTITKTVASGAGFVITWAESTFTVLTPGVAYTVEIRGRDTAGAWSPWSGGTAFNVNAIPAVPSGLTPSNSQPVSGLPKLSYATSDADNATSSLTGQVEITRVDTTTVTVASVYNATTGRFDFQTTSTELPTTQTFTWQARAYDGTYYSGWSAPATVVYGTGPTVTVTAPTSYGTVTVSTPVIAWTATGQVSRRVRVYEGSNPVPILDTGMVTTAVQFYQVPSGLLRNNLVYSTVVDVTNGVPLVGTSAPSVFTLDYVDPPAPGSFVAYPRQIGTDSAATAIELNWSPTTYPAGKFGGYDLERIPLGSSTEDPDDVQVYLRRITNPLQTSFTDYHPRSGVEYQYVLRQIIEEDLDSLESLPAYAQSSVRINGVILASALQPDSLRIDCVYLASAGSGPDHELKFDQRQKVPVGARRGRTIRGSYRAWEDGGKFSIVSDNFGTADQRIADIRNAVYLGKTFSFRDDRGRKRWVTIIGYKEQDKTGRYEIDLQVREEHFIEGESL